MGILAKHGAHSHGIRFLDDFKWEDNNEAVRLRLPEWIRDAHQHYVSFYGYKAGSVIFDKSVGYFASICFCSRN